ncbi:MAG: 23S rRNA (adenine(2503)-C(2))-methyltransferase RlmN [Prevotellaceae bacterium]|jgi:23S rRNA (adenine2503-C2)-methyltransferase|nr:23S rRNA (adenine(2503)-C(2))-methyltransferase RlmN [Prevotellaceae bacterium]
MKEALFGKTLNELVDCIKKKGFSSFYGKQIAEWIYSRDVDSIGNITNLSKQAREILSAEYEIGTYSPAKVQISSDGTKKYLYTLNSGYSVESVYIPETERSTLCISSQAGCRMACRFCMTARQGLKANLTAGEILNQIHSLPEKNSLTNIVYMGMGEPMDNIDQVLKSLEILTSEYGYNKSYNRITVSTTGITDGLVKFLQSSKCRLAISLHSPFDSERQKLVPMQKFYPVSEILKIIKNDRYQRRISFEYIMFDGVNDTEKHAKALVKMIAGNGYRVNLIRFHRIPDCDLKPSSEKNIEFFKNFLNSKGLLTTVRASRGEDIFAACGMLSTMKNEK